MIKIVRGWLFSWPTSFNKKKFTVCERSSSLKFSDDDEKRMQSMNVIMTQSCRSLALEVSHCRECAGANEVLQTWKSDKVSTASNKRLDVLFLFPHTADLKYCASRPRSLVLPLIIAAVDIWSRCWFISRNSFVERADFRKGMGIHTRRPLASYVRESGTRGRWKKKLRQQPGTLKKKVFFVTVGGFFFFSTPPSGTYLAEVDK